MNSSEAKTKEASAAHKRPTANLRTQQIADAIPSMVWTCRSDGHADYFNRRWYERTGQTEQESIGWGWAETIHPDDRERVTCEWQCAVEAGCDYEIELRYRLADGHYRWHLVRAVPVRDEEGNIDHWFGVCTDIDEKHESEEVLQAMTRAIVEADTDAILTVDERGVIQFNNQAAVELFGYASYDLLGCNVEKLMPTLFSEGVKGSLASQLKTGQQRAKDSQSDACGQHQDGSTFPMELSVNQVSVRGNQLLTMAVRDITENRRLESDLRGQARVFERLASGDPLDIVLTTLIEATEESRPEMIGSILLLDQESGCLNHGASTRLPDFYRDAIDGVKPGPNVGSCGTAAFTGERIVVEDIQAHPLWEDYRELADRAGQRACWSEPIMSSAGKVLGTFAMYYAQPRTPDESDLLFVSSSAKLAALAIERVQAHRELEKEKGTLEAIVNGVPDAIMMADLDRKITYCNPGTREIFGYESADLVGQSTGMLYANPADFERQGEKRFNEDADKHYEVTEVNWRRKNGEAFLGDTVGTVVHDESGEPVGYLAVVRDITDRKQAEIAIREREHHYRSVVETAGSAVICISEKHKLVELNQAAELIFGYTREQILGEDPYDLLLERDMQAEVKALAEKVNNGQSVRGLELPIRTRDGSQRVLVWNANQLRDGSDKPIGQIAVGQDITELKAAQDKLVQSERLAAMGQMMSSIAHESRNALQRIQAGIDMLKLDIPEGTEAAGDLAQIAKARSDLQTLLDGTRDFAAPVVLDLQKCNLADVWQQSWRNLDGLRGDRQAELVEETDGVGLDCTLDSFRVEQIFRNLIENSFAACSDPIKINVTCSDTELKGVPAVSISVRDNGPGLTEEQQNRIFDAFYTTKPKGTGLGMAIAMKTVKAHNGTLAARNRDGGGAEFVITLPREQGQSESLDPELAGQQ